MGEKGNSGMGFFTKWWRNLAQTLGSKGRATSLHGEVPVSQRISRTGNAAEFVAAGPGGLSRRRAKSVYQKYLPYFFVLATALMVADLAVIKARYYMIPMGQPPTKRPTVDMMLSYKPRSLYDDIIARNIFNSDGLIPDTQVAEGPDLTGPARESQLALMLVGTIVHSNPGKSVATIELKNNPEKIIPYIPNDEIEGMATLLKVERKRAYIRNLQSGIIEYIQIKDEPGISFNLRGAAKQDGPVTTEGHNSFSIARLDLETQMANLPELLTQARGVPNTVNGRVDGFKIVDIVPGSIYTKLGIQEGDVLKEVDGERLDSPAKAMELYNGLRTRTNLKISGERNGQPFTMTYNIRQ